MKIVIDISEEEYNKIKENDCGLFKGRYFDMIRNGTPLPTGHGRLVDADALILNNKDYIGTTAHLMEDEVRNETVKWINEDIENAPTIIEADKE